MQGANFVALTGHLNDYPLADLIGTLRRQRKTGRLLIEYSLSPCSLFFVEGNLVDAQLNSIGGLQAVLVALSQPNASFNFNPLIQPARRSINESSQKVVLELLGCWEEKPIDIEASTGNGRALSSTQAPITVTLAETDEEPLPRTKELLALPPSPLEQASRRRNRRMLIASAIISLLVSLLTVGAVTRWLIKRDISAALSEMGKKENATGGKRVATVTNAQSVKVVLRVEKGHVSQASVEEHHTGMEAYEALALRIARMRRYSPAASGQETVMIKINSPD